MPQRPFRLLPLLLSLAGGSAAETGGSATGIAAADRADLQKRLAELAARPAPKDLKMGAMCYKMALLPEHEEYICPACAQRSLFARRTATGAAPTREVADLVGDLPSIRAMATALAPRGITLDESRLCAHCAPGAQPSLGLVLKRSDGSDHRLWGVGQEDLDLLREFFAGRDRIDQGPAGEAPLRDHLPRLRELLGETPATP